MANGSSNPAERIWAWTTHFKCIRDAGMYHDYDLKVYRLAMIDQSAASM